MIVYEIWDTICDESRGLFLHEKDARERVRDKSDIIVPRKVVGEIPLVNQLSGENEIVKLMEAK